jgi:uncharacterized cupredoxin-like copper-binding protein
MRRIRESSRALLTAGAVLLTLLGCTGQPSAAPRGPVLDVLVKDFKIEPLHPTIENGRVTLRVHNEGPATHEFVTILSDLPADELPIASDGLSVDEDRVVPVGELTEVEAGESASLTLPLVRGRYVFFCNLEGHYLTGMYASIEVVDDV